MTDRQEKLAKAISKSEYKEKAAIAIDDWKLPIFERHLAQAGYAYTTGPGLSKSTLIMKVDTHNIQALEIVIRAANTEAARTGKPR